MPRPTATQPTVSHNIRGWDESSQITNTTCPTAAMIGMTGPPGTRYPYCSLSPYLRRMTIDEMFTMANTSRNMAHVALATISASSKIATETINTPLAASAIVGVLVFGDT